jgi:tetratricopeptide (TPR) repeat protein
MDRIASLTEVLAANPKDQFARYALAMEYSQTGAVDTALEHFATLLRDYPDYTPGYFMAAQTLATAERFEQARQMLQDGIACAARAGNAHAKSEMEQMLEDISR